MQKKILASLLMVPMAYSAFANIGVDVEVDKNAWTANGLVGDALQYDQATNTVTAAPVGVGTLTQTLKDMPRGTYSLTFTSSENVAVTVNGKALAANGEFTLDAKGDVTIVITGQTPAKEFKFTGLTLEVVCDFDAIAEDLSKKFGTNFKLETLVEGASAEGLPYDGEELKKEIDALRDRIVALRDAANQNLKTYTDEELWFGKDGNKIDRDLEALLEKVKEYNAAVTAANDLYNTVESNKAAKAQLDASLADLQSKLDAVKAQIAEDAAKPAYGEHGNYINEATAEDVAAAQAAIDAFKAAVEEAYKDLTAKDIKVDNKTAAIEAQINDIVKVLGDANADVAAYIQWLNLTRDFLATYHTATNTINALTGVEGYETVPDAYKAEMLGAVENIYNDAVAAFGIKEDVIKGAAALLAADKALMEGSSKSILDAANAAKVKVTNQNQYMTSDLEAFKTVQEALDAIVAPRGDNGKEIKAKKDAIQAEIDALKKLVDETYAKLELQVPDFSTTIQKISDDVKNLAAIAGPLCDLQKKLDDAEAKIKAEYPEIADKFVNTVNNIQAGIDALDLNSTAQDIAPVSDAIDEMLVNAELLQQAWDAAKAAVAGYDAVIASLNDLFVNKLLLAGNTFDVAKFKAENVDYKAADEAHAKFLEDYAVAKAAESQKCYDLMTALVAGYNLDTIKANVAAVAKAFEIGGSDGNVTVVDNAMADLNVAIAGEYAGKTDIEAAVAKINNEYNKIINQLTAAKHVDYQQDGRERFDAVDKALQALDTEIAATKALAQKYQQYQAIYDSFNMEGIQRAIDDDTKYNETEGNSTAPATAHWTEEIAKLQKRYDDLQAALDAALAAYATEDKNMAAVKNELGEKYNELLSDAVNLPDFIAANERANTALVNTSNSVRNYVNDLVAKIEAEKDQSQEVASIEAAVNEWLDQLHNLLVDSTEPEDLASVDAEEKGLFADGKVALQQEALEAKYEAVRAAAEKIAADFNTTFDKMVDDYNNSLIATDSNWYSKYDELNQKYEQAVTQYNKYMYGLNNQGYKDFIAETLKDHRHIYDYLDDIVALQAAVEEYVKAQNEINHIITAAEFKAVATDKANAIEAGMAADVAKMEAAVAAKAQEYYGINEPEALANILGAKNALLQAGIAEKYVNAAIEKQQTAYDTATGLYDDATSDKATAPLGLAMDKIADQLDIAKTKIDLESAAAADWADLLKLVETTVPEYQKIIDDAKDADPEFKAQKQAEFDEIVKMLDEQLPATAPALDEYLGYKSGAQDALDQLKAIAEAVKANSDANVAEQEAYKNYMDVVLPELQNSLDALKAFVEGLAAGEESTLATPEAALKAFQDYIEANRGNLVNNKTAIEALQDKFDEAVAAAYGTTATAENALLAEWQGKLHAAYNDANVNKPFTEAEAAEYKDQVDAVVLPGAWTPATKADEFFETAVNAEKDITFLYNELQGMWTEDRNGNENPNKTPYADALAEVNTVADAIQESLVADYEKLQGYTDDVKAKYDEAYQDLQGQLEQIKAEVTMQGANIILTKDRYIAALNKLAQQVKTTAEAAAADEKAALDKAAKEAASDAAYATLNGEWEKLNEAYEALVEKVNSYGEAIAAQVADSLKGIKADLDAAKADLDAKKAEYALTEESTLLNGATIESNIDFTGKVAAQLFAQQGIDEASKANLSATEALANLKIVPAVAKELREELTAQQAAIEELENELKKLGYSADVEDYEAINTKAQEIIAALNDILARAKDNTFVPGDVNLNPDGEVNITDLQLLITWVGEGMTFEQLNEMSPVAAAAADLNGDKELNVGDITAMINLVMNQDFEQAATTSRRKVSANGGLALSAIATENGVTRYAVTLNSAKAFVAGQMDVVLPEGTEFVGAELAGNSHQLFTFNNAEGARLIVASFENAEIALDGGMLLFIDVRGTGAPELGNALFTDAAATVYSLGTTIDGVNGIDAVNGSVKERIYNAAGQTMRALQRGINIIRHSDGTTTKEFHK